MVNDVAGTVFVDLSNVAKDPSLGVSNHHADLTRWDRLRSEWLRVHETERTFLLIADQSLSRALSRGDQARLDWYADRDEVVVVADADVEILRRAIAAGGIALSNDRFVDHRRIADLQKAKLVGWIARVGTVRFQERSLERLLSALVSHRAQRQNLKEMGLSEDSPVLLTRWYCRDAACPIDQVGVPRMTAGSARCPECGAFLDRGDSWNSPIWIKVMHGNAEILRTVLEDGDSVCVGSGASPDLLPLGPGAEIADSLAKLESRHAELRNEAGRLLVRDMGTVLGTAIRQPAAGQRNFLMPPAPLSAMRFTVVGVGSKVVLGRTRLTVQISGSRIA